MTSYSKEYGKQWYQKNKQRRIELVRANERRISTEIQGIKKASSCERCDEDDSCCLDFHHLNPTNKSFHIADAAHLGVSQKRLHLELAKCIVLCANCHRKEHAP